MTDNVAPPLNNASLHHVILRSLVDRGFAPNMEELCETFGLSETETARGLAALADDHGVVLHPDSSNVWIAHPFSTAPTNFLLRRGDREWWANCAWCALGAAALIGGDLTITTALGANGGQVTIHIEDGAVLEDDLLVHFPVPMRKVWDNVVYTCSTMLVFDTEAAIDLWCEKHRIAKGDAQPIDTVWRFASEWYGRHLDRDWRKWTPAEAADIFRRHGLTNPIWDISVSGTRF